MTHANAARCCKAKRDSGSSVAFREVADVRADLQGLSRCVSEDLFAGEAAAVLPDMLLQLGMERRILAAPEALHDAGIPHGSFEELRAHHVSNRIGAE